MMQPVTGIVHRKVGGISVEVVVEDFYNNYANQMRVNNLAVYYSEGEIDRHDYVHLILVPSAESVEKWNLDRFTKWLADIK